MVTYNEIGRHLASNPFAIHRACITQNQLYLEGSPKRYGDFSFKMQEELIRRNPILIRQFIYLDPILKEKYADLIKAQNSGYL